MQPWLLISLCFVGILAGCKDCGTLSIQYLESGKPEERKINSIEDKTGCAVPILQGDFKERYKKIHACSSGQYHRIEFKELFSDHYENQATPESLVISLFFKEEDLQKTEFEIPVNSLDLFMTASNVAGGIWLPKDGFVKLKNKRVDINVHWVPANPGAEAGEIKTTSAILVDEKKRSAGG